ncbi:MAG: HD domain-containing phosphohydrolase [Spirochaetota bacterium]
MKNNNPNINGLMVSLLDRLNEAVAICGRDGSIVYFNRNMTTFLNDRGRKPTVKNLVEKLQLDSDTAQGIYHYIREAPHDVPFSTTVLFEDGGGFKSWYDIIGENLDEKHVMISIRDVSDKKLARELLRFRVGFERIVTHISTYFINLDYSEIENGIVDALERIAVFSEADRAGVYFFNHDCSVIESGCEWCHNDVPSIKDMMVNMAVEQVPFLSDRILAKETVSCKSIDDLKTPGDQAFIKELPIKSFVLVPVVSSGLVRGIIGLSTVYNEKNWHGDIITLMKIVGEIFANARERKQSDEKLKKTLHQLRTAMGGVIQAMALTVESRDPYTAGHQRRVADLARAIAGKMGLGVDEVEGIRLGGIIHDLGKISVTAEILSKPGRISELEFELIKSHPLTAFEILKTIEFPWPLAHIVLQHHERYDGSGYPYGLAGEEINMHARILAVADVVEAMASHRPYRPALGIATALEEIITQRGVLYDPGVVDACEILISTEGYSFK